MGKESLKDFFHVTYNGVRDDSVGAVGVHVTARPAIPSATEKLTSYQVPGRDGALTLKDGTVSDISIAINFSFSCYPDAWQEQVCAIKAWLQCHSGAVLRFSDLPDAFYKVRYVELSGFPRAYRKIGTFTATFVCEGFQYLDSGLEEYTPGTLRNQWVVSHPLYRITATNDGTCTMYVNGKSIRATVAQNLTIDTERMMAYRTTTGAIMNTALIMGNYDFEDFYLKNGSNSVSITSGFTLRVVPNWRRL